MLQPREKNLREEKRGDDRTKKEKQQYLGSLRRGRALLRKRCPESDQEK